MKTCDYWFEDDEGRAHGKCGAPAHYTTCDPINGVTCERHKCRCAKPLPAEERIESLEREVRHLRERVRGLARRRKGLRYALRCMQEGRANDYKRIAPFIRRAYKAEEMLRFTEKSLNIAMAEGLKAINAARTSSLITRAWSWLMRVSS